MPKTEMTNMVMICSGPDGAVLVQRRTKSWRGLAFPGGHIEPGESFVDSAVREVKEETGLDVRALKHCGVVHWLNVDTLDRYLVFLYKTCDFSGELAAECDEGANIWMSPDELRAAPSDNAFKSYLPMFAGEYSEAFGAWRDGERWELVYK